MTSDIIISSCMSYWGLARCFIYHSHNCWYSFWPCCCTVQISRTTYDPTYLTLQPLQVSCCASGNVEYNSCFFITLIFAQKKKRLFLFPSDRISCLKEIWKRHERNIALFHMLLLFIWLSHTSNFNWKMLLFYTIGHYSTSGSSYKISSDPCSTHPSHPLA